MYRARLFRSVGRVNMSAEKGLGESFSVVIGKKELNGISWNGNAPKYAVNGRLTVRRQGRVLRAVGGMF